MNLTLAVVRNVDEPRVHPTASADRADVGWRSNLDGCGCWSWTTADARDLRRTCAALPGGRRSVASVADALVASAGRARCC